MTKYDKRNSTRAPRQWQILLGRWRAHISRFLRYGAQAANCRGKLAATATVLGSPPGNHLEALRGERKGRHSNRINEQWRICFV